GRKSRRVIRAASRGKFQRGRHPPLPARQRSRLLVRARRAVSRRRAAADRELTAEVALADFRKRTECATLLAGERYSDYRETPPQCRGMAGDEACARVAKKRPRLRD